jgi:hypothetical protein
MVDLTGGSTRRRWTLVAPVVILLLMVAVIVAMAGSMTYWFGLARPVTNPGQAQRLCEVAVRHDLLAPANALFENVDARANRASDPDDHLSAAEHVQAIELGEGGALPDFN